MDLLFQQTCFRYLVLFKLITKVLYRLYTELIVFPLSVITIHINCIIILLFL